MSAAPIRRPLSRRIMWMLFVLILVPIAGWSLLGPVLRAPEQLSDPHDAQLIEALLTEVRGRLVIVLVASLAALGGVLLYLRRSIIEPLASLAGRARHAAEHAQWSPPPERTRPDEIGDLAHALHHSFTALHRRAEGAVQVTANLSHELRTPLAAIRGAAELIDEGDVEPADLRRFARNIGTESQRLERLVVGLLDMHRADRDGPRIDTATCDLATVLRTGTELAQPLLVRKSMTVGLDLGDTPLPARISAERAQRVLLGLLENAIKFSPSESTITIAARQAEDSIEVELCDQGPGVPESLREAIFDRYFSAPREGGPGSRGTGLGLALVQSLVHGAGGRIEVDSGPSGGACFRFEIPRDTEAS